MRIKFKCPICERLKRFSKNPYVKTTDLGYRYTELTENNIIDFDCRSNHSSVTVIENQKFDLLFESGIKALTDSYNRESVSSTAASLERFYEFFIYIILKNSSINDEIVKNAWKKVSSQSERQLGAFIFLFTLKFQTTPPLLNNKMVQFRNTVIHKGYFPSKEESLEFITNVSEVIELVFRRVQKEMPESLKNLQAMILNERIQLGQKTIDNWKTEYPHLDIRPGINDSPKLTTFETFMGKLFINTDPLDINKYLKDIESYA